MRSGRSYELAGQFRAPYPGMDERMCILSLLLNSFHSPWHRQLSLMFAANRTQFLYLAYLFDT